MARNTRLVSAIGLFALSSVGVSGGPDAIVGGINPGAYFGQADGVAAYAFGPSTCNLGDSPLVYVANTNDHPVWATNLYRLKDGVFQQIGMSHLLHGFFALEQNLCAPCSSVGFGNLGPGCSDVTSSNLAGSQAQLGPRWQVNAHTGVFAFPFNSVMPIAPTTGRRLQAAVADVDPALNGGASYWSEVHIVSPGDAGSGNGMNNASSRMVQFSPSLQPQLIGDNQRGLAAIEAWAAMDDQVRVVGAESANEGRFTVASRAYDNGDGTWLYVYAIHNLNNDRSARAFQFDIGSGVVTDPGFHSPAYHSGDGIDGVNFSNTPWAYSFVDEKVRWETSTFDENPNANALRWGTVYSFWFTSTREPSVFDADLTLFKPGAGADTLSVSVIKPRSCVGDFDNGGTVNFADLNQVLAQFGQVGDDLLADTNGDGVVDFNDLNATLSEFGRSDCY
jgi:hypothetical protein